MITLHEGEKILAVFRRHWLVFFLEATGILMAAFVPVLAFWFIAMLYGRPQGQVLSSLIFFSAAWELFLILIFAVMFTNYYLDILIVTTKRLIDIEQRSLFARDTATIPIANIQDIKIETTGLISTLCRFGNLHVQTAGYNKEMLIKGIQSPSQVKATIIEAHHAQTTNHGQ